MFCTECGTKSTGGKFCANCGNKLQESQAVVANASRLGEVCQLLDSNWGALIQLEVSDFDTFSLSDWQKFQSYLMKKTGDFLHCTNFSEFNQQISLSDQVSQAFWDTTESIQEALTELQDKIDPAIESQKLMAVIGTRAKLSYGSPQSGQSYQYEAVENIENELMVLQDVLKIGSRSNLIGDSFDNHIEAIKLLSDFGKSFLVFYLGDTPAEQELLRAWAPNRNSIASSMTAAMVVAFSGEFIDLDAQAVINPRFIHMLIDSDNITQPWWLEMALWASAADVWKDRTNHGIEDVNTVALAHYLRNALNPAVNKDSEALQLFSQDAQMYEKLLDFLES